MQTPRATIFCTANLAAAPLIYVFRKLLPLALVVLLAAATLNDVAAAIQGPTVSADLCSIPKHLTRIRPNPDDGKASRLETSLATGAQLTGARSYRIAGTVY